MPVSAIYQPDLAYVHHTGFGAFATQAGPNIVGLLKRSGIRRGLIVDLGCGSGIWARHALTAGYTVLGIDISSAMVKLAKEVAPGAQFQCASLHQARLPACDVVTAIGEAINYASTGSVDAGLASLFARIAKALRRRGMFIFDVIVAEGRPSLSKRIWEAGKDWAIMADIKETRSPHRLRRRLITFRQVKKGNWRRAEEIIDARVFKTPEILKALRAAGFKPRIAKAYGLFKLLPRRRGFICQRV